METRINTAAAQGRPACKLCNTWKMVHRPEKNGFWTRCSSVCATLGSELPRPALRPTVNSFVERISAGAEQSSRASSSSTNSLPVCWQAGNLASSRFWPGHVQGSAKGEREPHPALATSLARLFGLDFSRGSRALRLTQWLSKSRLVPKQLQSLQARPVPPPLPCQGSCLRVGRCTRLSEGSVPHRCKQGCSTGISSAVASLERPEHK